MFTFYLCGTLKSLKRNKYVSEKNQEEDKHFLAAARVSVGESGFGSSVMSPGVILQIPQKGVISSEQD